MVSSEIAPGLTRICQRTHREPAEARWKKPPPPCGAIAPPARTPTLLARLTRLCALPPTWPSAVEVAGQVAVTMKGINESRAAHLQRDRRHCSSRPTSQLNAAVGARAGEQGRGFCRRGQRGAPWPGAAPRQPRRSSSSSTPAWERVERQRHGDQAGETMSGGKASAVTDPMARINAASPSSRLAARPRWARVVRRWTRPRSKTPHWSKKWLPPQAAPVARQ